MTRLKKICQDKGYTEHALSAGSGVNRWSVHALLNAETTYHNIRLENVLKLCTFLEVGLLDIVEEEDLREMIVKVNNK